MKSSVQHDKDYTELVLLTLAYLPGSKRMFQTGRNKIPQNKTLMKHLLVCLN